MLVYFDCQKHVGALKSAAAFYKSICLNIKSLVPFSISSESNSSSAGLELILKHLYQKNISLVLIFDEFEKAIIQETLLTSGVFGALRGIAQANRNFAWVTCTSRLLHDLFEEAFNEHKVSKARQKSESDFYNIAPVQLVGLFELDDTKKLISTLTQKHGVDFTTEDLLEIRRLGGNFPYFVQRACYHYFNMRSNTAKPIRDVNEVCRREFAPVWKGYYLSLTQREQRSLKSLIAKGSVDISELEIQTLIDTSLVYRNKAGHLVPFSEEFGMYIQATAEMATLHGRGPTAESENKSALSLNDEVARPISRGGSASVEKSSSIEQDKLHEGPLVRTLRRSLSRSFLIIRFQSALLVVAISYFAAKSLMDQGYLNWLHHHPKKTGIQLCALVLLLGVVWMIIDNSQSRRLLILGSLLLGTILVFIQLI